MVQQALVTHICHRTEMPAQTPLRLVIRRNASSFGGVFLRNDGPRFEARSTGRVHRPRSISAVTLFISSWAVFSDERCGRNPLHEFVCGVFALLSFFGTHRIAAVTEAEVRVLPVENQFSPR